MIRGLGFVIQFRLVLESNRRGRDCAGTAGPWVVEWAVESRSSFFGGCLSFAGWKC